MEMMKPTNPAESAWMLEHEMRMIQNSPPPPAPEPIPYISMPVEEMAGQMFDNDLKAQFQAQYQATYQSPYQSPPPTISENGFQVHEESMSYYNNNNLATPDYSTPPPSHGPSTENTPETRLTPYTNSPSPPAELEPTMNGHLMPSPGLSAGPSPTPGLSPSPGPSPGLSPMPSPGRSPGTSPGRSPGISPGRSPGRTPAGPPYVCSCGVVKNSLHQFNHHKRYHERPCTCEHEGCGRSFGTITHLKRHINDKHTKTRKFYCTQPGCDYSRQGTKSFPRKDNWKRHMLKKHSIDPHNITDEDDLGDTTMD